MALTNALSTIQKFELNNKCGDNCESTLKTYRQVP